jgi:hypothetical protein
MDNDLSYELLNYENKWVALLEADDRIVGVGDDAYEAKIDAERNGYPEVILLRVRDSDSYYCPAIL